MTKPSLPFLTRSESELLALLWKGPATVAQLQEQVKREVAYTTVLTLIRILEKKGYVRHSAHPGGGRAHLYEAAVTEDKVRRHHLRDFVDRLFGGRLEALVAGLLDDEALDPEELEALRARIDARLKSNPKSKRGK